MFCSECGEKNEADATFCTNCGKKFLSAKKASSSSAEQPSSAKTSATSATPTYVHTELKDSGTVTAMSVIGFVFGLIGMMGSFIPCIGSLAFYIGIPAALISALGLFIAYSQQAKKTFAVVAVTISLIGVVISGWQYFSIVSAGKNAERELKKMFNQEQQPEKRAMQAKQKAQGVQAVNQPGPVEKIILKDSIKLGMSLDNVLKILNKQSDFVDFRSGFLGQQSLVKPESYPGRKLEFEARFKKDKIWSDTNTMSLSFTPPDFDEAPNQLYNIEWTRKGDVDMDFNTITKFITQNGLQKPSCNTPFDVGSPGFVRTSWHAVWLQPYASYEPSYGECGPSYNIMENFDAFLRISVSGGHIKISLHKAHLEKKFDEFFDTIKQMERREKGKDIKF